MTGILFGEGGYITNGLIESNQQIIDAAQINYNSRNTVLLLKGFEVETDAVFEARIGGCEN